MKKEDLFEAMEDIDERFIAEGREEPASRPGNWNRWVRFAVAAAAILLIGGIIFFAGSRGAKEGGIVYAYTPIEKHVASYQDAEIFEIPHWEDMMNVQRYMELTYDGKAYRTMLILVHDENVGTALGEGDVSGQDVYANDAVHTLHVPVFSISGIVPSAAVCIVFPDEPGRAYAYVNTEYRPDTLGQFMEDLNFAKYMKTGVVIVNNHPEKDVAFEDIDTKTVTDMLLSDPAPVNEPGHTGDEKLLSVSISLDVIGNHYKTLTLTKDGYLWTNLLESEKCFFIGKEKAEAFLEEVVSHHQGYLYIYDLYDEKTGEIIGTAAQEIGEEDAGALQDELITETTKPAN